IRTKVDESPAWAQGQIAKKTESRMSKDIFTYLGTFAFLVVLMFAFNSFSHGSQDLYPTFLTKDHKFTPQTVGFIAVIANLRAMGWCRPSSPSNVTEAHSLRCSLGH